MKEVKNILLLLIALFTLGCSQTIVFEDIQTPTPTPTPEPEPEPEPDTDISSYIDLSAEGTANCYLVKSAGTYKFKAVKGNSTQSVGAASSADVLWESFGTSSKPNEGDLIASATYKDGYVYFATPTTFKSGNASIAVRDSKAKILWSWHIWLSKEGWKDDVYPNNAGTMMDRNLGATSATPGSVGAFGLLYQWGRKDPFLGSSSISSNTLAKSTGSWSSVYNTQQTVDYVTANPMTFVCESDDWCTGDGAKDSNYAKRWTESIKSMYDPCPVGYRVPEGGRNDGFWATALGTSDYTNIGTTWDSTNKGRHWTLSDGTTAWYPAVGCRRTDSEAMVNVGSDGYCWSASPGSSSISACHLLFNKAYVYPRYSLIRSSGYSVRCVSATATSNPNPEPEIDFSTATDLSAEGTANCYLVKSAGTYKFKAVKGNSTQSVDTASSADVLWESFGTATTPNVGDLIASAAYKDGYVYFATPTTFKSGNASIAVRDTSGTILWSWHIWCSSEGWTDDIYPNNAGTMMDRNLGATSATPGSVGALGLMYQWGRKDPFVGSSSISSNTLAVSTGSWSSVSTKQTVDYVTANPLIFVCGNGDWCTGDGAEDSNYAKRWTESTKSMYDPCPVGYRVPDGGKNGFWATALGASDHTDIGTTWDSTNSGRHWTLADGTTAAWYPVVGCRNYDSGSLSSVGSNGFYWSAYPGPSNSVNAYSLVFSYDNVYPACSSSRSYGFSVRCVSATATSEPTPEPTEPANNEIWYTSTDGKVVTPAQTDYQTAYFNVSITSNTYKDGKGVITFSGPLTTIGRNEGEEPFANCAHNLKSVVLPKGLKTIGYGAFSLCSGLESVTIPETVTYIKYGAFYDCDKLTAIALPSELLRILTNQLLLFTAKKGG